MCTLFAEARKTWAKLRKRADWRSITDGSRPELEYAACILGQSGAPGGTRPRVQTYEVFVKGKLVATRHTLTEARDTADDLLGTPGFWTRRQVDPVMVTHYYFGDTEEFGPTYFWTREA